MVKNNNNNTNMLPKTRTSKSGFNTKAKVDEPYKIAIDALIDKFIQAEDETQLEFPPTLGNDERKHVHQLCKDRGLRSKSTGKEPNRRLTVFKQNKTQTDDGAIPFTLTQPAKSFLHDYFAAYPILPSEVEEELTPQAFFKPRHKSGKSLLPPSNPTNIKPPPILTPERAALPIYAHMNEILTTIAKHDVTIISGETGSGKSTQVVQYLLDHDPRNVLVCTQPRRIAAISLADRVAEEREERTGQTVGFMVRLESSASQETRATFCTTGVVLSSMREGWWNSRLLAGVTHLVIDEVHERDKNTDFLLIYAKQLLLSQSRPGWAHPKIKIVLMSATMNEDLFGEYFGVQVTGRVSVKGSLFRVNQLFLEDILKETNFVEDMLESSFANNASNTGNDNGFSNSRQQQQQPMGTLQRLMNARHSMGPPKWYRCPVCLVASFATPQELGVHALTCRAVETSVDSLEEYDVWGSSTTPEESVVRKPTASPSSREEQTLSQALQAVSNLTTSALPPYAQNISDETAANNLVKYQLHRDRSDKSTEVDLDLVVKLLDRIVRIDDLSYFSHLESVSAPLLQAAGDMMPPITNPNKVDIHANAILIFLPGWSDISDLCEMLESHPIFGNTQRFRVLPLHSGIPTHEQKKVFLRPPQGMRKIVCSTNLAETSLTIEDVAYVIDSGLAKEKSYDPYLQMSTLLPRFIARANVMQRRGRAGRCRPGVCFHLYSGTRFTSMERQQEPELRRTPLDELCLHARSIMLHDHDDILKEKCTILEFLCLAPNPPNPEAVKNAIRTLKGMGALDHQEQLTHLGMALCKLPVEPRVGRALLFASLLSCVGPCMTLAVASGFRDVFVLPMSPSQKAKLNDIKHSMSMSFPGLMDSDHAAVLQVFKDFIASRTVKRERAYCGENMVSFNAISSLEDMRRQVALRLAGSLGGMLTTPNQPDAFANNENRDKASVVQALLCILSFPNIAMTQTNKRGNKGRFLRSGGESRIRPHASSALRIERMTDDVVETKLFVFEELIKGVNGCTIRCISPINVLCLCLFGGYSIGRTTAATRAKRVEGNEDGEEFLFAGNGNDDTNVNDCFRIMKRKDGDNDDEDDDGLVKVQVNSWLVLSMDDTTATRLKVLRLRLEKALHQGVERGGFTAQDKFTADVVAALLECNLLGRPVSLAQVGVQPSHHPVPNKQGKRGSGSTPQSVLLGLSQMKVSSMSVVVDTNNNSDGGGGGNNNNNRRARRQQLHQQQHQQQQPSSHLHHG